MIVLHVAGEAEEADPGCLAHRACAAIAAHHVRRPQDVGPRWGHHVDVDAFGVLTQPRDGMFPQVRHPE